MLDRYSKNLGFLFNAKDQEKLLKMTFLIIGAGGTGGYMCDYLARLGCHKIILFDDDKYEISNANRQLQYSIDMPKVEMVEKAIVETNPLIEIEIYQEKWTAAWADRLDGIDVIIDCAGCPITCKSLVEKGIPYIVGGVIREGITCSLVTNPQYLEQLQQQYIGNINFFGGVSNTAYLNALSASFTLNELLKYLTQKGTITLNCTTVLNVLDYKIEHNY